MSTDSGLLGHLPLQSSGLGRSVLRGAESLLWSPEAAEWATQTSWSGGQGSLFTYATGSVFGKGCQAPSMPFSSSDKYAVRFIPRENGVYLIDVKFNGTHIPGSPFKIRVGEPGHGGDPGLVSAYGSGLEGGVTGRSVDVVSSAWTWLLGPPPPSCQRQQEVQR